MHNRSDFIIKKLTFSILTLFAVIIFNFALFRILPGDPLQMIINPRMSDETKEILRQMFGLDKPVWFNIDEARASGKVTAVFDSQFFIYVNNLAHGELGMSFHQKRPVSEIIRERLIPTSILIITGELISVILGTSLGLLAAWKQKSRFDKFVMFFSLTLWSLPAFWLGMFLLLLARGHLPMAGWITPGAIYTNNFEKILDITRHLILPSTSLALLLFAAYVLVVRNSSLEVLTEDYILTAKAKGLSTFRILLDHTLKNASLPLVTLIALDLGYALGGTIQIETIFSYPGVGSLMFNSIGQRDYPVLQGVFLLLALVVIGANFLADLTYTILDPRVRD